MSQIQFLPTRVGVIGDIVGSRSASRHDTHALLVRSLKTVAELPSVESLAPTIGDEIQGVFDTYGHALHQFHLLRLLLREGGSDIRCGIGVGEIEDVDTDLGIQDGSAWWNAREALNSTQLRARRTGYAGIRTTICPAPHPCQETLDLIDAHISSLKPAVCGTLYGMLTGLSNAENATRLSISPSANTQRIAANNLRPLATAMTSLWSLES